MSASPSSTTAGHLRFPETSERIEQRFYWPGFQEDTKLFDSPRQERQKRSGPPLKHYHWLVEWNATYPFHHIETDFMAPFPLSTGYKHILGTGFHFTNRSEAIHLGDQTTAATKNSIGDHWVRRLGGLQSRHSYQGRFFQPKPFEQWMHPLGSDKTRTTPFDPHSDAVVERMNGTSENSLAKHVNEEQSNWSQQLPYAMMAYRFSVHGSTIYTSQFLVTEQELYLPFDRMYPYPQNRDVTDIQKIVHQKQQAFQRAP